MTSGIAYTTAAFLLYGFIPVYYKLFGGVSAIEIAFHRFAWAFPMAMALVLLTGQFQSFRQQAFQKLNLALYSASAITIGSSSMLFIWAVNHGYLIEISLGAFLNPLILIVMGVFVLGEKLRTGHVIAFALAAIGFGVFSFAYGKFPWVAILSASADNTYSMLKKKSPLPPLNGIALEFGILFPFCIAGLVVLECQNEGVLGHTNLQTTLLLVGTGVATVVPLLLLVAATQLTPFFIMGLLANSIPTIQFILGVVVYNEPFSTTKLIGFGFVWLSLIVFIVDCFLDYRSRDHKGDIHIEFPSPIPVLESSWFAVEDTKVHEHNV